jgi:hypothetical protein
VKWHIFIAMSSSSATSGLLNSHSASGGTSDAGLVFAHSYATVNVKSHISMMLELQTTNFNKWSSFRAMCSKFDLLAHITVPAPDPRTPTWEHAD